MTNEYPFVVLVVPVYNNKADTEEFLASLSEVVYPNYEIIIVDDGSTDGLECMIRSKYPEVNLLKGDGNLWWSKSINWGIKEAIKMKAEYVLLINNDCTVDKYFISFLVETAMKNPKSLIISKVLYYNSKNTIWEAGADVNWLKGEYTPIGRDEIDIGQYESEYCVKCSTLVGSLIDVSIFQDLGLMDEDNFPMYKGDIDFTYRAFKRGYSLIYQPKSVVWHKVDSTVKKFVPNTATILSTFSYLTSHTRSPMNFKVTMKYYFRHCPVYFLPLVLSRYFAVLILKSLLCNPLHLDLSKIRLLMKKF